MPYLSHGFASAAAFLDFGLPKSLAFLKKFSIVLLHWTLVKLDVVEDAPLLMPSAADDGGTESDAPGSAAGKRLYPVVVVSHGALRAVSVCFPLLI